MYFLLKVVIKYSVNIIILSKYLNCRPFRVEQYLERKRGTCETSKTGTRSGTCEESRGVETTSKPIFIHYL